MLILALCARRPFAQGLRELQSRLPASGQFQVQFVVKLVIGDGITQVEDWRSKGPEAALERFLEAAERRRRDSRPEI